jgi:hypothetical protein
MHAQEFGRCECGGIDTEVKFTAMVPASGGTQKRLIVPYKIPSMLWLVVFVLVKDLDLGMFGGQGVGFQRRFFEVGF